MTLSALNIPDTREDVFARVAEAVEAVTALGDVADPWLLLQNRLMVAYRRQLLPLLGLSEGDRFLDAGCGYGLFPLEVAASTGASVVGLDADPEKLEIARSVEEAAEYHLDFAPVSWVESSLEHPDLDPASFDVAAALMVFQHLGDPAAACRGLFEALAPGGRLFILDVDDGYDLEWPPRPTGETELADLVRSLQRHERGDRAIGRKLPSLLDEAGFQVAGVQVLLQYGYGEEDPTGREHWMARVERSREEAIDQGLISADRFDELVESARAAGPEARFSSAGQMLVAAVRP